MRPVYYVNDVTGLHLTLALSRKGRGNLSNGCWIPAFARMTYPENP